MILRTLTAFIVTCVHIVAYANASATPIAKFKGGMVFYGTPSPRPASIDTHTISTTTEDSGSPGTEDSGSPLVCSEGDREFAASYGSV